MDLISIIIPVYNVEAYLDRCILSVVSQTYPELEIILIDDGSTDNCSDICDHWAARDPRIRVIRQANAGLSAARNAGLAIASGSYLFLLDSDDYIAHNAVELLLHAVKTTDADMVICDFEKGSDPDYAFARSPSASPYTIDSQTALQQIYTGSHNALRFVIACCKLYKRSLYSNIRYPEGKIFEDIYTTHKLLYRCNRIAMLDMPLLYYFQRPDSIMNTSFNIKKLDYLQALVERVDFFRSNNLQELSQIAYDELLHSLIWEYSRTRDILHSEAGMAYVAGLFRSVYRKGHSSTRYPQENRLFLSLFYANPEWIILFWKVRGKLNHLCNRKE